MKSPTCQKPNATWNNNDPNLSVTYLQKIAVVCQTIHGLLHIPIILLCQLYVTPLMAREFIEMPVSKLILSNVLGMQSIRSFYGLILSSAVVFLMSKFIFSLTDPRLKTDLLYNQLTLRLIDCICFY